MGRTWSKVCWQSLCKNCKSGLYTRFQQRSLWSARGKELKKFCYLVYHSLLSLSQSSVWDFFVVRFCNPVKFCWIICIYIYMRKLLIHSAESLFGTETGFLRVLQFSPVNIILPWLHTHISSGDERLACWWLQFTDVDLPHQLNRRHHKPSSRFLLEKLINSCWMKPTLTVLHMDWLIWNPNCGLHFIQFLYRLWRIVSVCHH
jgi:hypothetical protein